MRFFHNGLFKLAPMLLLLVLTGCAQKNTLHTADDRYITIRLEEVDESTVVRAFGKVIRSADGVVDFRRNTSQIVPGNTQQSFASWTVLTSYTDILRLEDSIIEGINMVLESGGRVIMNGVRFDFSPPEVEMLKGVRILDSSANQLRYVVDRELARDRDFSGRLNPYNAQ